MPQWIIDNVNWIFSGIGISLFIALIWIVQYVYKSSKKILSSKIPKVKIGLFPRYHEGYASIIIENTGNTELMEYSLYLNEFYELTSDKSQRKIIEFINPENASIMQAQGLSAEKVIRPHKKITFNLARVVDDKLKILFTNGLEKELKEGVYYGIVEFIAKRGEKLLNGVKKKFYLEFTIKYPTRPIEDKKEIRFGIYKEVKIDVRESKVPKKTIQPYINYLFLNPESTDHIKKLLPK